MEQLAGRDEELRGGRGGRPPRARACEAACSALSKFHTAWPPRAHTRTTSRLSVRSQYDVKGPSCEAHAAARPASQAAAADISCALSLGASDRLGLSKTWSQPDT